MLCWFQVNSELIQLCVCVYIHIYILFSTFFSLVDYYKILGIVLGAVHRSLLADAKF